jgi:hypothetical protein
MATTPRINTIESRINLGNAGTAIAAGGVGSVLTNLVTGQATTSATYSTGATITFTTGVWILSGWIRASNSVTAIPAVINSNRASFTVISFPGDSSTSGNTLGVTQIRFDYNVVTTGTNSGDFFIPINGLHVLCDGTNLTVGTDSVAGLSLAINFFPGTFSAGGINIDSRLTAIKIA